VYAAAKAAGKTSFGSAKTPEQIDAVIRNTAIQGTLSIVFAVLVVTVVLVGVVAAIRAARGGGRPLTEDGPVPSKLFAPRGLIPTATEREVQRQWDALPS
jgi:carbon starvation protein